MIQMLVGAGILSKQTGIEINTLSKPDEKMRISKEEEDAEKKAQEIMLQQTQAQDNTIKEDGNEV